MTTKQAVSKVRGWFPQDPALGIIRSVSVDLKPGRWVPLPSISGLLLIVAALLSLYFGSIFSQAYNSNYHIYYAGLPIGVLHFAALGLELFSAGLLLTKKHTSIAVAGMVAVLLLGLSVPLINMLDQPTTTGPSYFRFVNLLDPVTWMNGLFLGSPLIAFSTAGLIMVGINQRRNPGLPGVSAKTAGAALAVFWAVIAAANLIQTNALINLYQTGWLIHSPMTVQVASLLGGAALGAVLGSALTRLQLKSPAKAKAKPHSRLLGWGLAVGAAVATVFLFTGFLSLGVPADTQFVLLNSIFGVFAAAFIARTALLWRFEKQQNISIRQNGLETFAVAKEAALKPEFSPVSRSPILLSLKSVFISAIVVAGFAGLVFVLTDSWIRLVLLAAAVVVTVGALALKGKVKVALKYTAVSVLIFCLCFTAYEASTFSVVTGEAVFWSKDSSRLSVQNMGNISVKAILDGVENSQAASLLRMENHEVGTLRWMDLRLATEQGHIALYYSTKNANESVDFYSPNGNQYSVRVYKNYSEYPDLSLEEVQASIDQIDALGLRWFYDRTLEAAQNSTLNLQSISVVVFSFNYFENVESLVFGVSCHSSTPGSNYYPGVASASFRPDGTLISNWTSPGG